MPDFTFKKFSIAQDRCAMKVGTDGVLLGAWATGGNRILDVGTGTGVIALMMAQRFHNSFIEAIDIDMDACKQASENVSASPFAAQISVKHISLQDYVKEQCAITNDEMGFFDSIVCNPPFFSNSLKNSDKQRTLARHTDTLQHEELMTCVAQLLEISLGELSVIVPADAKRHIDDCAALAGLFPSRAFGVYTSERKPVRRFLLAYRRIPSSQIETDSLLIGGNAYRNLLKDFYLQL